MGLKPAVILSLALTIIVLMLLAYHPAWYFHLHTDANVYWARANYFLNKWNFEGLVGNEYQPGALIFFITLSPFLLINNTFQTYLSGLFSVNILLMFILVYLYKKYSDMKNVFLFALILLFTGPIVLFRFDLYVMSILIASFLLWKKNQHIWATVTLAYAALIKIFPIIFLPYYLIIEYKNKGLKNAIKILLIFSVSYFSYITVFSLVTDMNLPLILSSFGFIANTPVHTESTWAILTTLLWKVASGEFPKGAGAWGIFGIAPQYQIGPLWFYNYFWIIPLVIFYLWLLVKIKSKEVVFDIRVCLSAILLFLLFSKILHHQYTLWFMLLLPLIDWKIIFNNLRWTVMIFLTLMMTFINQYIYPLHFNELGHQFFVNGSFSYLFALIILRNLSLAVLVIGIMRELRLNIAKNNE